jgi:Fe-S cluster assembly ATP-binding protein
MNGKLIIDDLHASVEDVPILKGINLSISPGEIHAVMGPNGSGKSTLAHVIAGHPAYRVTNGSITLDGEDLLVMEPHERALRGLFLSFQHPVEIPGLTVGKFFKRAAEVRLKGGQHPKLGSLIREIRETLEFLELDRDFINRYLNTGFSGGEKKRMEIAQMLLLKPVFAILDETDSGLDIDALKVVAKGINKLRGERFGSMIITHYQRILDHVRPDAVHVLYDGRIVRSGGTEVVESLEKNGYDTFRRGPETPQEAGDGQLVTSY